MNIPSCIEEGTKDKTMLVRFGGSFQKSIWINGLSLLEYCFDMEEFLTEEHGVGAYTAQEMSKVWEVAELNEEEGDLFESFCFNHKGEFDKSKYECLHKALADHSTEKVEAAIACGIDLTQIDDCFLGESTVRKAALETFWECCGWEIPKELHRYICEDTVVDVFGENLEESGGFVFDASR